MTQSNIHTRFIKGLAFHNLTYEDIRKWSYCGGDTGRHLNYFNLVFKIKVAPSHDHESNCVCGQEIQENCYIIDPTKTRILVSGNCCIRQFIPKSGRTCSICSDPHKNRIVNRCNKCRVGRCDGCDKKCNSSYKKCYRCYNK